jgi:hypothetical protein
MATALDIITAASIKVGVESPTAAQTATALISLNNMVSLLGVDMIPPVVTSEAFSLVVGDSEYTIGNAGSPQWNTVRPDGVKRCFLRDSESNDYPVSLMSSKDYNALYNKAYSARPTALYFLPEFPLAKIIFNTAPDVAYSAYFEFMKTFTEFATSGTTVSLPNEYKEALVYNLAVSLGEDWDRVVPKTVYAQAVRTREVLDYLTASRTPPPVARFDFAGTLGMPDTGLNIQTGGTVSVDGGVF